MATGRKLKYLLIPVKNTGAAIDRDDLKNLEAGGALDEPRNGARFRMRLEITAENRSTNFASLRDESTSPKPRLFFLYNS